ncbi:hypothetical protein GCM10011320_21010 [Neoroseomonas lacus]|uniref:Uncharacterized protein n=1 Tax=Neoroseomonas lacus TaxID=287609 RepID=A0A917KGT2_9PROT|nr:hypothetical protein GCM10011320_21010 [Neoroseomonas lacus]
MKSPDRLTMFARTIGQKGFRGPSGTAAALEPLAGAGAGVHVVMLPAGAMTMVYADRLPLTRPGITRMSDAGDRNRVGAATLPAEAPRPLTFRDGARARRRILIEAPTSCA